MNKSFSTFWGFPSRGRSGRPVWPQQILHSEPPHLVGGKHAGTGTGPTPLWHSKSGCSSAQGTITDQRWNLTVVSWKSEDQRREYKQSSGWGGGICKNVFAPSRFQASTLGMLYHLQPLGVALNLLFIWGNYFHMRATPPGILHVWGQDKVRSFSEGKLNNKTHTC